MFTKTASQSSLFPPAFNTFLTSPGAGIRTSLSLLEMLVRLTSLQQFQQASHLAINDELLNFFLEESSTTGAAAGDTDQRKRVRMEARQKVGFDPYNESPIKRRGENYQYHDESVSIHSSLVDTPDSADQSTRRGFDSTPASVRQSKIGSRSRSGTPLMSSTPSSPLQRRAHFDPTRQDSNSLATPPGSTKSREAFLREESASVRRGSGSPLARKSVSMPSLDDDEDDR